MKSSRKLIIFGSAALLAGGMLAACGGGSSERIKIGIVMYSYSDIQGQTIQDYCSYVSENLPIDFAYEATNYQDDLHISAVENLLAAGCKGIIAGYDTSLVSALDTVAAAGAYYAVALDHVSPSDFGETAVSPYFVGGTQQFGGDLAALGEEYAEAAVAAGLKDIGGVSFPAWAFTDGPAIYTAFQSKVTSLDSAATVHDLEFASGFLGTDVQTATNNVLTNYPDVEAIFGMSSGIDYVYPVIRDRNVKLISMGYDSSVRSLIEAGSLVVSGNNNHVQSIASCIARLVNAIDGNSYSDASSGAYNQDTIVNGVASYPLMSSTAEVDDYINYGIPEDMSNGSVSADELKNVIIRYNSGATLSALNTLTNRSIAEIKAARNG